MKSEWSPSSSIDSDAPDVLKVQTNTTKKLREYFWATHKSKIMTLIQKFFLLCVSIRCYTGYIGWTKPLIVNVASPDCKDLTARLLYRRLWCPRLCDEPSSGQSSSVKLDRFSDAVFELGISFLYEAFLKGPLMYEAPLTLSLKRWYILFSPLS